MADSFGSGFPRVNINPGHIFFDIDTLTAYVYIGGDTTDPANWVALATGSGSGSGLTAGTPLEQTAPAGATVYTGLHGLGTTPSLVVSYFECLVAEHGYSVGDRVTQGAFASSNGAGDGYLVEYDATTIRILMATNGAVVILDRTTPGLYIAGTGSSWKVVAQPYA